MFRKRTSRLGNVFLVKIFFIYKNSLLISTNYEIDDKLSIIDCAVTHNSLKFLRHLWIIQNQYQNLSKKTKSSISVKESILTQNKKIKSTRRSLLIPNAKHSNSDNFKATIKLIDLSYLIKSFADSRRQSSIK